MKIGFRFKSFSVASGITWMLGACTVLLVSTTVAQENVEGDRVRIRIVDQDGETVKGIVTSNSNPKGISVRHQDGKIIIVDADGKQRVIDVQGATRIAVNQEVTSTSENGKTGIVIQGKAIIIGPDGKRQEIILGNPMLGDFKGPAWAGLFQADRVDNKFMIGINCQPLGESLQVQLDLEPGTGLIVVTVNEESAASTAGIQKHDILMTADDRQLSEISDLVEAVQTAGKGTVEISLSIIRAGKEISVEVTPTERPENGIGQIEGLPEMFHFIPEMNGRDFNFKFKKIEPGIVFEADFDKEFSIEMHRKFEAQLEEMQNQMERFREQLKAQQNEKRDHDKER